jgi:hypothetical protein
LPRKSVHAAWSRDPSGDIATCASSPMKEPSANWMNGLELLMESRTSPASDAPPDLAG